MSFHRWLSLLLRLKAIASIWYLVYYLSGAGVTCSILACINGYLSLHNKTPLHITLSQLVITSHCICFYYIMICPVSSAYTIGVVSFAWPRSLAVDFEQLIALVICFLHCLLTRYWFVSCLSGMCHQFCLLCIYVVLTDFEQVIVPVLLCLALFVD